MTLSANTSALSTEKTMIRGIFSPLPARLEAGDVVVQQATNHAWLNHGREPCRIVFVLLDSKQP
jgi:hypothetical protein